MWKCEAMSRSGSGRGIGGGWRAVPGDGNSAQKHAWRARIILATAEGCGTAEVMRRAGVSKLCVWRWQRRFVEAGVDGLLRDKSRKPGKAPVPDPIVTQLIERTLDDPPGETTRWTSRWPAPWAGDQHGPKDLACPRPGPASAADLQAQPRPAVRHQGSRRRRALRRPAGARGGAFGR